MICQKCEKEIAPDSFFCQWCGSFLSDPGRGKKASLFRRWLALTIDPLLAVLMYFAAMLLSTLLGNAAAGESGAGSTGFLMVVLFPIIYFLWFLTLLPKGLTPGKKLLGLRVIDHQTGAVPGFGRMFIREIPGRILSGLFLSLGYFWALWDKNAQAWHDKLAGTVVVKTL